MEKKNRIFCLAALLLGILLLCSCGKSSSSSGSAEITAGIEHDTKYNMANVILSQEEFEAAGFCLGDSCDIEFENGYTINDVPYYNGYYVRNGDPVIVAYPGFSYIGITYNNTGIWDSASLSEGDTVTIRLNEAGKYSAVQEGLGQVYSFLREDYTTDEEFCNFRALTGGHLKENFLYRGASPVDNSRGRAAYTDGLLSRAGIAFVLDLADSEEDMAGYLASDDFASFYAEDLYKQGQIALLGMGSGYQSEEYCQQLVSGLKQMLNSQGPVYIHCMEGKDRTGFVCMLLEALAGADYEEMRADYMITYQNYYSVSEEETPEKYDAIVELYFDAFVSFLHGTDDMDVLYSADYTQDAADYLISGGMTEEEVSSLIAFITE